MKIEYYTEKNHIAGAEEHGKQSKPDHKDILLSGLDSIFLLSYKNDLPH